MRSRSDPRSHGHLLAEIAGGCAKLRNCDPCTGEAGLGNGFIRLVSLCQCRGTAMEWLVMRPLTSVLVVLILALPPITVASAQQPNPAVAVPSPLPDISILDGRIPGPLPAPSPSTSVNGPVSQQGSITPLPAPLAPVAPPSGVPSVFQSQTGL